MGLPRRYRLASRPVFNRVLKSSRLAKCPFGLILGLPKLPQHQHYTTQMGIIISKKVHKRANKRNRLRRQLRAIILALLKDNPALNTARCWVVVLKPEAVNQPFATLSQQFGQAFLQAGKRLGSPNVCVKS